MNDRRAGDVRVFRNELNIKWIINDAKNVLKNKEINEFISSPPIFDGELKWFLTFFPAGRKANKTSIFICIWVFDKNNTNRTINYKFSICNENEQLFRKSQVLKGELKFRKNNFFRDYSEEFFATSGSSLFSIGELDIFLILNKNLIINCKIKKSFENLNIGFTVNDDPCICENSVLSDKKNSDVELKVRNKSFLVNKVTLASKSPVFMEILNKRQVIEIKDISVNAAEELVNFIETNKVKYMNQFVAQDLLLAANKYDISELKKLCELELIKNMTIWNVISYLILASSYNADDLKMKAIDYIAKNVNKLNKSENWTKINSSLMTEIISALSKTK